MVRIKRVVSVRVPIDSIQITIPTHLSLSPSVKIHLSLSLCAPPATFSFYRSTSSTYFPKLLLPPSLVESGEVSDLGRSLGPRAKSKSSIEISAGGGCDCY
ncbi:hypothetical protein Dimus_005245 [Dionaea muscipula]